PIEFFTEVRGGTAVAPAAEVAAVQRLPSLFPGNPVGTSYLLFIDDFFSLRGRRDEVLRAVKADLARLGPEDRMAVVRYDGRRLDSLSSWSRDAGELARSLDGALQRSAHGIERLAELASYDSSANATLEALAPPPPSDLQGASGSTEKDFRPGFSAGRVPLLAIPTAQRLLDQERDAVDAAAAALCAFASPPGRKVLLLLEGGWPLEPQDYVTNVNRGPLVRREVEGGEELFRPLVDTANRLGYTIYPIDVPGIQELSGRQEQLVETLEFAAAETGGRTLQGDSRGTPLASAAADTRSYYWLGFTPTWKGNDKRHKIEITAARPGLRVRSRGDFLDLSRRAEVSNQVESAMLFGGSSLGGPEMKLQLGQARKSKRNQMEVPLTLAIPVTAVTPVETQGEYVTELEVRVAARDKNGDRSDVPVIPVRFKTKKAPAGDHYFKYETTLALRRIQQHVVFAVYDPLSQRITTIETDVEAP
ncbi:MAG TPA: VWA domain-containing protein, partial [Thermoanaerobaculia bacterium]